MCILMTWLLKVIFLGYTSIEMTQFDWKPKTFDFIEFLIVSQKYDEVFLLFQRFCEQFMQLSFFRKYKISTLELVWIIL